MTLYLLNGGESVPLPTRPIVVRVQSGGGPVGHRLVAAVPEGAPAPVALERHGMLVLPRLTAPTAVRLMPQPGLELFAGQTVLTVLVGPDGGDPDADYAQISVDVSGLPVADLLTLRPGAGSITVTALGRRKDPTLPPHAELARDVARELLGLAYVSADRAVDLVIGVDCSPSMRSYVGDGLLEAVLETFAGVASVIDPNGEVEGVLCGRQANRLAPDAIDTFAASTVKAVAARPLVTGLRSAVLDASRPATLTYLVTDALPPDLNHHKQPLHVVLLADQHPAGRDDGKPAASVTTIFPQESAYGSLKWDRHQARAIVESLLVDYVATARA